MCIRDSSHPSPPRTPSRCTRDAPAQPPSSRGHPRATCRGPGPRCVAPHAQRPRCCADPSACPARADPGAAVACCCRI
eukprot:1132982-Prymnesium_polylepis.1